MTSLTEDVVSVEVEYFEAGRSIGLTGANPSFLTVFRDQSAATRSEGEMPFYRGLLEGRKAHAEQVGYALGLGGQHCDRPATVHRRFDRQFTAGWQAGADEWADREAILHEDDQQEFALWQEREHAEQDAEGRFHDAEVAEAGGWYRATLTRGGRH